MPRRRPAFDPDKIAAPAPSAPSTEQPWTVSRLNSLIKQTLTDHLPTTIHLAGEISNLSTPASGHIYMTLKDANSEIRAVMWRSGAASLKFKPTDGMEVVATGKVDVYEPRGQYQFYIRKLEPRGVGSLELAFRQLHDKLKTEGLFNPERKKPIPVYPRRIAVVTSDTGAAIRDILTTLERRFPCVEVCLHPVRVQGEGAAEEIAAAIDRLNQQAARLGGFDVMIVGRGGGSLEDLWAFNEEVVARAIHASHIPVISAVGHEVDVSIADLVADVRAPTPTAAAEMAVPVLREILDDLATDISRIGRAVRHAVDIARSHLRVIQQSELFRDPVAMIRRREQLMDELNGRLTACAIQHIGQTHRQLHQLEIRLTALQPKAYCRQQVERLAAISDRLNLAVRQRTSEAKTQLNMAKQSLRAGEVLRRFRTERDRLQQTVARIEHSARHRMALLTQTVKGLDARLEATSYRNTLARGFTITRTKRGNKIIRSASQTAPGDRIVTETSDGEFDSRVTDARQGELFD
jgi:exodeoxyribonuclease VII large subunit